MKLHIQFEPHHVLSIMNMYLNYKVASCFCTNLKCLEYVRDVLLAAKKKYRQKCKSILAGLECDIIARCT